MRALLPILLLAAVPAAAQDHAHHRHAPESDAAPRAVERQLAQVRAAVDLYRDVRAAEADGWKMSPIGKEDSALMGEHWYREGAREIDPGEPIDFAEPTNLQYALVNGRRELVGASFVVRLAPGDPLPEGFAGDADHWHVHDVEKAFAAMTESRPLLRAVGNWWLDANYRSKGDNRSRLAMVHAWVAVPSPDGPFAMHNVAIPYLRAGLPLGWAVRGDETAANGVNLATPNGCKVALDGRLWIAHATSKQSKRLRAECEGQAGRVRDALARSRTADAVNAAARDAWRGLESALQATLDPRQRERIAALTEHDPMAR